MHNHNPIPFVFVPLSKGQVAIVDAEDAGALLEHRWCVRNGYASRDAKCSDAGYRDRKGRAILYMHNIVLPCGEGLKPDHINGNTLDNRKQNLRCATHSQNLGNRKLICSVNTSGYRGVYWGRGKWVASIGFQSKTKYLGRFDAPEDAALAYDKAAVELFGEFAKLNFPEAR